MNRFKTLTLLTLIAVISFGAVGCKRRAKQLTPIPNARGPIADNSGLNSGQSNRGGKPFTGLANTEGVGTDGTAGTAADLDKSDASFAGGSEDREKFAAYTVYFAYDSAVIGAGERDKVASLSGELKRVAGAKLKIEGHCDERGTPEYNRALGSKRGHAVREALIGFGVPGSDIEVVSMGEDDPADLGHDDGAWSKNRRAEFIMIKM